MHGLDPLTVDERHGVVDGPCFERAFRAHHREPRVTPRAEPLGREVVDARVAGAAVGRPQEHLAEHL